MTNRSTPDTHTAWRDTQATATVTVDGHDVEMAYHESGPDDAEEPPVVFLHGIPTWSFLWRNVVSAVNDERRVIAPDLVGYGESSMADRFDRSIRAQEAALSDLLAQLDEEEVDIVAHDIGGGVALRYAAHEPESVRKLVLSNAVAYDSWPVEFIANVGLPRTAEMDEGEFRETLRGTFEQGTVEEADEAFVDGMVAPWDSEGGQSALARAGVATNTNHTTELDYGAIEADLLCLWGEDDEFQPIAYGERLVNQAGGQLVPLENAYHWVVEDRTETYREELRTFLIETPTEEP